jgi:hypothetical protein
LAIPQGLGVSLLQFVEGLFVHWRIMKFGEFLESGYPPFAERNPAASAAD